MEESTLMKLQYWAATQPNKTAWTFLNDQSQPNDSYTYLELERITTAMASWLLEESNIRVGDRVLLVFFPGLHFMISLLACFKAGIIAVPVFPPDPRRQKKDLHHFISIQSSSGASVVLTHNLYGFAKKVAGIKNIFSTQGPQWPDLRWVNVDSIISKAKSSTFVARASNLIPISSIDPNSVAFLQYTSGSTSEPKGVMITHSNLTHNEKIIARELQTTSDTICVSWLPQYHDMGLIGSYLGLLYCGGSGYYLSPISFLKDPTQWIRAMSLYHATHTQAPNFAYALATRKFLELSHPPTNLDLSSLQHMINAAEPVDCYALQQFRLFFAKYRLSPSIIYPTYGLAEHTVFVCSGGKQILYISKASLEGRRVEVVADYKNYDEVPSLENSKEGDGGSEIDLQRHMLIVGCGYPGRGEGVVLKIVDPDTGNILQEDDMIGEIWVSSPSKAIGYWDRPELSQQDFHAIPTEYLESDTFLRTGDLGFLHEQELFICGRIKDLIIVRGSNHYPQDIERTVEQNNPLIRPGCTAAFSINFKVNELENGETHEAVVLIAEIREDVTPVQQQTIIETCLRVISSDHGIALHAVVLLKTRSIPKTTSGKVARSWCRKAYLEQRLEVVRSYVNVEEMKQNEILEKEDVEHVREGEEGKIGNSHSTGQQKYQLVGDGHGEGEGERDGGGEEGGRDQQRGREGERGGGGEDHNGGGEKIVEMKSTGPLPSQQYSPDDLRAMSLSQIEILLEEKLIHLVKHAQGGGGYTLTSPLNRNLNIASFGLDSMLITQYKGVLENRFSCEFPDEFMFTKKATLKELAIVVKHGHLTTAQAEYLEKIADGNDEEEKKNQAGTGTGRGEDGEEEGEEEGDEHIVIDNPICPWFTCCY